MPATQLIYKEHQTKVEEEKNRFNQFPFLLIGDLLLVGLLTMAGGRTVLQFLGPRCQLESEFILYGCLIKEQRAEDKTILSSLYYFLCSMRGTS